jgi:hypothetical protein
VTRAAIIGLGWLLTACAPDAPAAAEAPAKKPRPTRHEPKRPTTQVLCQAYCDLEASCGGDGSKCRRDCVARGRSSERLRGDFMWNMLSCVDSLDCGLLAGGDAWNACFAATAKALPMTEALRRFCFEASRGAARCGRRNEVDQTECRDRFRHLESKALDGARQCLDQPCAEVPGCFRQRFGI